MDDILIADFRRAVRGHLAERPAIAQSPETICRHLRREFSCDVQETQNALLVLLSLGHLKEITDKLGGREKYYKATADGIFAHERGD